MFARSGLIEPPCGVPSFACHDQRDEVEGETLDDITHSGSDPDTLARPDQCPPPHRLPHLVGDGLPGPLFCKPALEVVLVRQ